MTDHSLATNGTAPAVPETPSGAPQPGEPQNLSDQGLADWREFTDRAKKIAAANDWSRAELARRSGIPHGTLTPVLDGVYTGSYPAQLKRLRAWLESLDEVRDRLVALPEEPGYFETPTSRELKDTLLYAQQMPQMAVVTMASGMGKTTTAKEFRSRPGVFYVTMRPTTSGAYRMLQEIAIAIGVTEMSPARLDRAIGEKLKRNGRQTLLIVDEAQNLADQAVDQLRYFFDEHRCGIALLGNDEIYSRFGRGDPREGFGQIHRRIGKRMRRMKPLPGDIEAALDAWRVADPDARKFLAAVGRHAGALGQIAETTKLALMIAAGEDEALSAKHVRLAWDNRGGGEARP
jgi:DNA transposition AAA+ family ATPase